MVCTYSHFYFSTTTSNKYLLTSHTLIPTYTHTHYIHTHKTQPNTEASPMYLDLYGRGPMYSMLPFHFSWNRIWWSMYTLFHEWQLFVIRLYWCIVPTHIAYPTLHRNSIVIPNSYLQRFHYHLESYLEDSTWRHMDVGNYLQFNYAEDQSVLSVLIRF